MTAISKIELDARLLRAARPFQGKKDMRRYLNGVHLDSKGFITATNGHVLFRAKCPEVKNLTSDIIIDIKGTIPTKSIKGVATIIEGERGGLIEFSVEVPRGTRSEYRAFEIIEGKFPDVEKVLPKGDAVPMAEFRINPSYMALVDKASKALGSRSSSCVFRLRGNGAQLEVNIDTDTHKATIVIMPIRL